MMLNKTKHCTGLYLLIVKIKALKGNWKVYLLMLCEINTFKIFLFVIEKTMYKIQHSWIQADSEANIDLTTL